MFAPNYYGTSVEMRSDQDNRCKRKGRCSGGGGEDMLSAMESDGKSESKGMNGNDEGKKEWVAAMGGGFLAGLLSVHGAKGGGRASDRGGDGAGVFSPVLEAAAAAEVLPFSPRQAWLRGLEHGCSTCTPERLDLPLPQPQSCAWCCCGSNEYFIQHSGQISVFGRTEAD